jgi:eukaryotic-like serine/threonine-protein kinase
MLETVGHYKVLDLVGSGGIGEVFRARDTRLGRTVALKAVRNEITADPERRAQFLSAARRLTALSHPNIAALYEVIEEGGLVYLAQEFVPGEPLRRLIAGRGLNARRAIDYAIQIADALAEAHAADIAHRDLSTANVIITPKGTVKILELGLTEWTRSGRSRGQQDDVFSLGTVIFEMITGRPFDEHVSAVVPQTSVGREVPVELDPIVARMITKDGAARYESPAIVAADLRLLAETVDRRTANDRPVLPTPATRRSGHAVWWVLAAVTILLAAGAAWFLTRP